MVDRLFALVTFLKQFNSPLIYLLLIASVVTAVVKGPIDAISVVAAVVVNAAISFLQESRSEEAIGGHAQPISAEGAVVRAGATKRVDARPLMPEDVVLLKDAGRIAGRPRNGGFTRATSSSGCGSTWRGDRSAVRGVHRLSSLSRWLRRPSWRSARGR